MKFFIWLSLLGIIYTLPVKEKKDHVKNPEPANPPNENWEQNLEYGRYLKEVVNALESDPEFRKKLDSADPEDIKSGKIATNLNLVDHKVRTKLDEFKRMELERLRQLAVKEHERQTGDRSRLKIPSHIDHTNKGFESADLRKLIQQLNIDLDEADTQRHDEFKQHEMQKEFDYQQKLKGMDEQHMKEAKLEHEGQIKKHKDHPKLHHPGSKDQLEEVWEEQDHLSPEDFDPVTFFKLHDLDGNGYWDQYEVKTLFQKDLDKMYDPNNPEDDQQERYEEMERMREHVFRESDQNRDNLISFEEFMNQTKRAEFERHDEGWEGLDEQDLYSQQEYEEYERQRREEIQQLIDSGAITPPPGFEYHPPLHANEIPLGQPPPHVYQQMPQGGYQAVAQPQGYQGAPQGYQGAPQGYQAAPQGYQAAPQGYQAAPQAYPAGSQGHQPMQPQGGQAIPPQGYPANQGVPQGQPIPGQNNQQKDPSQLNDLKANAQAQGIKFEGDQSLNRAPPPHPPVNQQPLSPNHPDTNTGNLGHVPPVKPIENNRIPGTK